MEDRLKTAIQQQDHVEMLQYFEQLKLTDEGLEFSLTSLLQERPNNENNEQLLFFHWKVLEHHIKFRYNDMSDPVLLGLRKALVTWLETYTAGGNLKKTPTYLRNKFCQIFALHFSEEFLTAWPSMILDLMKICLQNEIGADFYLRMLLAIDLEVVDRSVVHSEENQKKFTKIKDTMRESCIPNMVESWYNLLHVYSENCNISELCLNVIGSFIGWIDINMIANEGFLTLMFRFLAANIDSRVREATCDCLREIAIKGMMPLDKLKLVEILWPAIEPYCNIKDTEDIDYVIKLSKLVGGICSTLIFAWNKLLKSEGAHNVEILKAIEAKTYFCFAFLGHEDDDVSQQCFQFTYDYLDMLKKIPDLMESQRQGIVSLFHTLVKKFKYDPDYCFENEGEDEAEFKEYLKGLKVAYDNLIQLKPDLVQEKVLELLKDNLGKWRYSHFTETEVCIRLLYNLGESLPSNLSCQFLSDELQQTPLHHMMTLLTSSEVYDHPHSHVRLMFFETVVRYDRYFLLQNVNENILLKVTQAFLDNRGIRASDPAVRSRCAYLLSRFVKTVCKTLQAFTEELLNQINILLVLSPTNNVERILSDDDQLFVYELAGTLIVNSNSEEKNKYMTALLRPLVEGFEPLLKKMHEVAEMEERNDADHEESVRIANTINYAMSYASRTSKAFSNKHTMAQAGCSDVYTETLRIFLSAFDVKVHHDIIHSGIRQYLHRMVICLEDEVLPYIPIAIQHLLKNCTARALHQFIPLLNQIVNKFKKSIVPFLRQVFIAVVHAVFHVLSENVNENVNGDGMGEDKKAVRRSYFQFIHAIVLNEVVEVILGQEPADVQMVLSTLKQGAVDYPDPAAQKICFSIFRKLLDTWKKDRNGILRDFVLREVVCSCFQAPLHPGFDMTDAQTVLILKESSNIMQNIHQVVGQELVQYLRLYLPTLKFTQNLIEEYCQALTQLDSKSFRNFTKKFFETQYR